MSTNIILFDFEVFKYDTLLGAIIINSNDTRTYQTWNLEEIKKFYMLNTNAIWIGHNNSGYDNYILQAVVENKTNAQIKTISDNIIRGVKKYRLNLNLNYYDLMQNHMTSLKTVECAIGKNISTTEVAFDLDRPLTEEERTKTESYNRDDLSQTFDDFNFLKNEFMLRLDIIKEFNLPLKALHITGTQLAEMVLHAEAIPDIESQYIKPIIYPQLKVKNQKVLDFYLNEDFRKGKKLSVELCGVEHKLGAGGIHAAKAKYHADWALYFDVSGYYNLVMINYDLLPRSIPDEYKQFYKHMYEEQLKLKKTNPGKRWVFKTILLSVFGAMTNRFCKFYDPNRGTLVTMVGQMFLVDLLEKLEGKVDLIQSNTDGIIAAPLPGVSREQLTDIINEWQQRTGFVLKLEDIYNIHQRDVNCYMYKDANGNIHTLGEAVRYYEEWENPFYRHVYQAKEPVILNYCVVESFMNGVMPEEIIEKYKRNLRMFQYIAKKVSYDWTEYELVNNETKEVKVTHVGNLNRAFAMKDKTYTGMIYKCRKEGKVLRAKVPSLPDSVFIYNDEILSDEAINKLVPQIDYDYYVKRAYERIQEFVEMENE